MHQSCTFHALFMHVLCASYARTSRYRKLIVISVLIWRVEFQNKARSYFIVDTSRIVVSTMVSCFGLGPTYIAPSWVPNAPQWLQRPETYCKSQRPGSSELLPYRYLIWGKVCFIDMVKKGFCAQRNFLPCWKNWHSFVGVVARLFVASIDTYCPQVFARAYLRVHKSGTFVASSMYGEHIKVKESDSKLDFPIVDPATVVGVASRNVQPAKFTIGAAPLLWN